MMPYKRSASVVSDVDDNIVGRKSIKIVFTFSEHFVWNMTQTTSES